MLCLPACKKVNLQPKTPAMDRSLPDETSFDVNITQFKDNLSEYHLEAKKIERFYDRKMLYGYGVTLSTYEKDGSINSVIKADTTIVDDARNLILASGNTVMTTPNGTLRTQSIAWDRGVDEITAPQKVKLTREGNVMYGDNLRTNSKLSFVEMDKVSAEGLVKPGEFDW
jgi:LPS export ABC transporter protein LptC